MKIVLVNEKAFARPKCAKRKTKRSTEYNLNTQTWVNRSTYLKKLREAKHSVTTEMSCLNMMTDLIGLENFGGE